MMQTIIQVAMEAADAVIMTLREAKTPINVATLVR